MARAGSLRVTIAEGGQAHHWDGVHARNSLDVAKAILQRNLTGVDKWNCRGPVSERDLPMRTFDLQPMMTERTAVLGTKLESDDASGIRDEARRRKRGRSRLARLGRIRRKKTCREAQA